MGSVSWPDSTYMRAASGIFLSRVRVTDIDGQTCGYYLRQFQDWKGSAQVATRPGNPMQRRMVPARCPAHGRFAGNALMPWRAQAPRWQGAGYLRQLCRLSTATLQQMVRLVGHIRGGSSRHLVARPCREEPKSAPRRPGPAGLPRHVLPDAAPRGARAGAARRSAD